MTYDMWMFLLFFAFLCGGQVTGCCVFALYLLVGAKK